MSHKLKQDDEIDVVELFGLFKSHKKNIIIITLFFCFIGIVYSLFAAPIYKADALIQVENNKNMSLLGEFSATLSNAQSSSMTEIELIKSRMVLGKTIRELVLDVEISPQYFPFVGKGWARLTHQPQPQISMSRFETNKGLNELTLMLTVNKNNTFTLVNNTTDEQYQGQVGQIVKTDDFTILINEIRAPIGTKFTIKKQAFITTFESLLKNLHVADKGKDIGILTLTYLGEDPVRIRNILNNISNNYLLQNIERKSEEVGKSLVFLNEQLPNLRNALNEAETKLNRYRQENESVDLSLEAKSVLEQMVIVESQLKELQFKESEISKLYTKHHPIYISLMEKKKALLKAKEALNHKVGNMPKTQQEILRLTRDVESGQEVYMQLLNKQQEMQINKASTIGNVRIIDPAITQIEPIKPNKKLIVLISTVIGFILSVAFIFVRSLLNPGIKKSEDLESQGVNVYALVPRSQHVSTKKKSHHRKTESILALHNPLDPSIEAIRGLRTSLHFALLNAKNNILMISGATAGVGKSFISSNLAVIIAQLNKNKVLLIDSDMRKGYLHRLFKLDNNHPGLSEHLSGKVDLDDTIYKTEIDNLHFISRGQIPPNPSELLMHSRFKELLDWANEHYNLVIIDTPPILPVTDAAIIGCHVGCSLMIVRYNLSTLREVHMAFNRFEQSGINIRGVILNFIEYTSQDYKYNYYHYTDDKKQQKNN